MAASAFGAAPTGGQSSTQVFRPDTPHMADAQAHRLRDVFGGQVLAGPQPQALKPLKGRFPGSRQLRAMDRADLRGGDFSSGAHNCPTSL